MNILFLMKAYDVGGIETVTAELADFFYQKGHNTVIAVFKEPNTIMVNRTSSMIKIFNIGNYQYCKNAVNALRNILIKEQINIVINQWGLPYIGAKVLNKAKENLNIKTIAIYHNDPITNARIKEVELDISYSKNIFKRSLLNVKKKLFKYITSRSMRYVYNHSDIYQVLSPSFVEHFKTFTGIKNPKKLMVQTNPVTIDAKDFIFNPAEKEKEILYVGRIDYNQKRVYRVIDTWALLEKRFPDWRLTIVGDGIERKNIERKANELGLKHVTFEGFQTPEPYYKRARILLLTSEYEGFPLVLAECMSFGVVPIVYGSYSAVYDIINNNKNGIIIPYRQHEYSAEKAANFIEPIINNDILYRTIAKGAITTSKNFSIEDIYNSWEKTFNKLYK